MSSLPGGAMADFVLGQQHWPEMPSLHRRFLAGAVPKLQADPRLVGLAAGGSFAHGGLDEHSDLDLIVVCAPGASTAVLGDAQRLAAGLGPLLAAFTGDHVGEPRLLICLYGPPLLHVDLKFLPADQLAHRVEDPVILWDRLEQVHRGLSGGRAAYPEPELQWIEDRFWVWVHYLVSKIARGELFEMLDGLAFLRGRVLGPLALLEAGARPNGVRRVEERAPGWIDALSATVAAHDSGSGRAALEAAIEMYLDLRDRVARPDLQRREDAEHAARAYLVDTLGASKTDRS